MANIKLLKPDPSGWILLVALLGAAGCYWQKYDKLVRTHVEILDAMAGKMQDLVRRDGRLEPEQMAEFRYPLERAKDFARIVRGRYGGRESFLRFARYLERYADLLAFAEGVRADSRSAQEKAAEMAPLGERLREEGSCVLDALTRS